MYNNAEFRASKKETSKIGDNSYVSVARAYYNSSMYTDGLGVIPGIFDETIPVFNAVPKVVNIAAALAIGEQIEPAYEDSEWVQFAIDNLGLDQEKMFMTRDLILGKSILVEIQSSENYEEEVDQMLVGTDDFPYALAYYPSDEYEVLSIGSIIHYAKIKAVKLQFDPEAEEYKDIKIDKIYLKRDDGTAASWELIDGEKVNEVEYEDGFLPIVEISTTYDMTQLFYSIDRHNELESFIRNIFFLAGEPILAGMGLDKFEAKNAAEFNTDRYKKLKVLLTKADNAKLSMIEIQGSSATIMISKQAALIESIIKDYPEYAISEVLSGGNVSEETTRIRLTEVLSRVTEVRRNMEIGINKILGIVAFYDGKDVAKKYATLGSMLDVDLEKTMSIIKEAMTLGLISRKSAMYQLRNLFIGEDIDIELAEIESQGDIGLSAVGGATEGGDAKSLEGTPSKGITDTSKTTADKSGGE